MYICFRYSYIKSVLVWRGKNSVTQKNSYNWGILVAALMPFWYFN